MPTDKQLNKLSEKNATQITGAEGDGKVVEGSGAVTTDPVQAEGSVEVPGSGVVATPVTTDASQAAQPVTSVPGNPTSTQEEAD